MLLPTESIAGLSKRKSTRRQVWHPGLLGKATIVQYDRAGSAVRTALVIYGDLVVGNQIGGLFDPRV